MLEGNSINVSKNYTHFLRHSHELPGSCSLHGVGLEGLHRPLPTQTVL